MDETAIAFEPPHARASATHAGPPLDRISVRDYVRAVEIGAFRSERGVSQRIRFNVVLEVSHHAAAQADDVDQVISYDTITEAIDAELEAERINLLETLAERVARRCLADPRAVRVFVRVEKLDRIPGALGVEIVRSRPSAPAPRLRPVDAPAPAAASRPRVVHLSAAAQAPEAAAAWLDALARWGRPVVVALAPRAPLPAELSEARLRIGLLAIEQAAWALAELDPRWSVVETRTELDWRLKAGGLSIWAPTRMVAASRRRPALGPDRPVALAAWLAGEIGVETLVIAGDEPTPAAPPEARAAARPHDLTAIG